MAAWLRQNILHRKCAEKTVERYIPFAEPQPIFYKNRANERKENLFSVSRVQPIFYKDS